MVLKSILVFASKSLYTPDVGERDMLISLLKNKVAEPGLDRTCILAKGVLIIPKHIITECRFE